MSSPTVTDLVRHIARTDHLRWRRAAFKWTYRKPMLEARHFNALAEACDAVMRGEITRLNVNMSPRFGKTEDLVVMLYSRLYAVNPAAASMHLSYSDPLVRKNSRKIKAVMDTDEFKVCFPEVVLKKDSFAQTHWETTMGGEFHTTTPKSSMTGFEVGGDGDPWDGIMVIDDAQKGQSVYSPAAREEAKSGVHEAITTRLNHPRTPVIHVQQRLHEDDCTNFLLSGGTGDVWDTLVLQAEGTDKGLPQCYGEYSHCNLLNFDQPKGSLWPARKPLWSLHQIRDAAPSLDEEQPRGALAYATQYQQNPTSAKLAMFRPAWLPSYKEAEIPWSLSEITMRIDTAQKGHNKADYNGLLFLGHDKRDKNTTYILDAEQKRCEFPELIKWIVDCIARMKLHENQTTKFTRVTIEDANIGSAVMSSLKVKLKERNIKVSVGLTPSYGNKFQRAMESVPFFQRENFLVPAERTKYIRDHQMTGIKSLISQFKTFNESDTHAFDDILDCLCWEAVTKYGQAKNEHGFIYGRLSG